MHINVIISSSVIITITIITINIITIINITKLNAQRASVAVARADDRPEMRAYHLHNATLYRHNVEPTIYIMLHCTSYIYIMFHRTAYHQRNATLYKHFDIFS